MDGDRQRLLAAMPPHAITSTYREAGLSPMLLLSGRIGMKDGYDHIWRQV